MRDGRRAHPRVDRRATPSHRRTGPDRVRGGGLANPTAALRDDVTATLQAAVADPEVAARLGRLTKAEQWSGFGEFGDTAIVFKPTGGRKPKTEPKTAAARARGEAPRRQGAEERRRRQEARAALAAAERAKAEADDALKELQSDLATARLRRDDARRRLQDAEGALTAAEDAYDKAKQASRDAAAVVKEAKARLK